MTILEEAEQIINGERKDAYGPVEESFKKVATIWSVVLGYEVTPAQVALCMVGLKLVREVTTHKRDNLVDAAGYLGLMEHLAK